MLEIALRNQINAVLSEKYGADWLFEGSKLKIERQNAQKDSAIEELIKDNKPVTNGRLVAALPFSFWTSMFNSEYEEEWQQGLHKIGRRQNGKGLTRKNFSKTLTPVRILRNRIAHHEPILNWNLQKHHDNIMEMCEWLSPGAAEWCRAHCRFMEIHSKEQVQLKK